MKRSFINGIFALGFAAGASVATAAFTPITNVTYTTISGPPDQFILTSLTANGNTVPAGTLGIGTSTGSPSSASTPRMDDFDLGSIATGHTAPLNTVLFGGEPYTNVNGILPDFFLFEAAGSGANPDDITVAAIFLDDSVGQAVTCPVAVSTPPGTIPGWGNTGLGFVPPLSSSFQVIAGLCWDIADLRDASGNSLSPNAVIKGIQIAGPGGSGIDPVAFLTVVPPSGIDHFSVATTAGSPQLVGVPFDVTITARDPGNVTVDNSFTTVAINAAGTLMEFDWNNDGAYGDNSGKLTNGVATIKARNKRAETTAAGVVASAGSITTVSAPTVTTIADVFSQLQVLVPGESGAPGTASGKNGNPMIQGVGVPFAIMVNAVDRYWNFLPAAPTDTISIITTNGTASADAPLIGGTVYFTITFTNNGPALVLVATNLSNGFITNGVSAPIISSQALIWQGDGAANNWDVLTTTSWSNLLGTVTTFNHGDYVTFDDTGDYSKPVNVVGTVYPISVVLNTANDVTFISTNNGGIAGTTSLQKVGAGDLRIATSNSYTGGTRFADGALTVAHANAVPNSGALIFTNATLLLEADFVHSSGSTRIVGSPIGSGGSFTIAAVGGNRSVTLHQLTWGGTANNLFPGELSTQLILGRASDNTTLEFTSGITLSGGGIGGDRTFVVADGSQAVDVLFSGRLDDTGATPGTLVKLGAGTLQLSHPTSSYPGDTKVEDGRIILTGGFNSGSNIQLGAGATSGMLQLGDASTNKNLIVKNLTTPGGNANRVVGGNTSVSVLTVQSNTVDSFSGVLGGAGANQNNLGLTLNSPGGTFTLNGNNTYVGATTIDAGTLVLNGSGAINNSTTIEVKAGATFDVSGVSFALGVGKTLAGGGTVNGHVTANGTVAPGSTGVGKLTFNNNLTLGSSAALVMEINPAPLTNDTVTVSGNFTPGGTLIVTNLGATAALAMNDTFQLFTTAVSGFSSIQLPPPPPGLTWTNKLAVDGSIALLGSTPASITFKISGGNLILNWPAGQGWQLQSQTNTLAAGLKTNWVTVPGAVPPFTNTLNSANGSVFYRLVWP